MEIKVTFTTDTKTGEGTFKFSPVYDTKNFTQHYANLLNGFMNSAVSLLSYVSILRPVTQEERDLHIFVFKTDDKEDNEHKLYNMRKQLYDAMRTMMNEVLENSFPDVMYIEESTKHLQEQAFDDTVDHEGVLFDIQAVTDNVRAHYDELIEQVLNASKEKDDVPTVQEEKEQE